MEEGDRDREIVWEKSIVVQSQASDSHRQPWDREREGEKERGREREEGRDSERETERERKRERPSGSC